MNPYFEDKLIVLGLPAAEPQRPASEKGVLNVVPEGQVPSQPFEEVQEWVSITAFKASSLVLGSMQVWCWCSRITELSH